MKKSTIYDFGGTEEQVRDYQKEFLKYFNNSKKVLDIGSGRGIFLELLKEKGIKGIGIDTNEYAIKLCQQKGFDVIKTNALDYLAQTNEEYDGIFCGHVIEHFQYEDVLKLIQLVRKVLVKHGIIVIVVPNPESFRILSSIFWLDPTHVRLYPGMLLSNILSSNGFAIVRLSSMEKYNGPKELVRRMIDTFITLKFIGTNLFLVAKKI